MRMIPRSILSRLSLALACGWAVATAEEINLAPALDRAGLTARKQHDRPTCSVFTVTAALEYALAKAAPDAPARRLSVEYLNWAANQERGHVRDGGFFSELWDGYAKHGIMPEMAWPYARKFDAAAKPPAGVLKPGDATLRWIKRWDVKTGLDQAQFAAVQATLRDGWPVCGGFRWPLKYAWTAGKMLRVCTPEEVFDGHSVLLIGYHDDPALPGGGAFRLRDSATGEDRFMPYSHARAYMNDAVVIQPADPSSPPGGK